MSEYRVDIKVRNNLILTKVESFGYSSIFQFCEATGVPYATLNKYIGMRQSIYDSCGKLRKSVERICYLLNCLPEELFSASQAEACLKDNKRSIQVQEAEVRFFLEGADQKLLEEHVMDDQLSSRLEEQLNTLTPREQKAVRMRSGMENGNVATWEEIGNEFEVTRERARQIEARAMRKLRCPGKSEKLREFLEED